MFRLIDGSSSGTVIGGPLYAANYFTNGVAVNAGAGFTSVVIGSLTTDTVGVSNAIVGTAGGTAGFAIANSSTFYYSDPPKYLKRRWRKAEKIRRKAERKAERKATALLVEVIGRRVYDEYRKHKYLEVFGNKHRYRLRPGVRPAIMKGPSGDLVECDLCIHPTEILPPTDTLIAQLMLIVYDEEHFLNTANRYNHGYANAA